MDETKALTEAIAAWVSTVLNPETAPIFDAMQGGRCDVAVQVLLREGSIVLKAIDQMHNRYVVLHREDVAPLRL